MDKDNLNFIIKANV